MTSMWSYASEEIEKSLGEDSLVKALEEVRTAKDAHEIEKGRLLMALKNARDNSVAITFSYGELCKTGFLCIRGRKAGYSCQRAIAGLGVEDASILACGVNDVVRRVTEHLTVSVKDKANAGGKISARKIKGNPN